MDVADRDEQPAGSVLRRALRWLGTRVEILVPVSGVLVLRGMAGSSDTTIASWQTAVVIAMAIFYMGLVLWQPLRIPSKAPADLDWAAVLKAAKIVVPVVIGSILITTTIRMVEGRGSEGSTLWGLLLILLLIVLGTLGLAAERSLSLDLLPLWRGTEWRRLVYVLVAAFFLAMVAQLWGGIWQDLFNAIGRQAFGEPTLDVSGAASEFTVDSPLRLLVGLLIGAGLFEELLFRLGILTLVWASTRRFSIGLVVSALLFGLYHVTPLSGMESYLATPFTAVMTSAMMGVYMSLIYRYRGFMAAVLVHGLGDWVVIMLLT